MFLAIIVYLRLQVMPLTIILWHKLGYFHDNSYSKIYVVDSV